MEKILKTNRLFFTEQKEVYVKFRATNPPAPKWLLLFLLVLFEHFLGILSISDGRCTPIWEIGFLASLGMPITGQL